MLNIYGMKKEADFYDIHRDFLRNEGVPSVLRRDNSKTQQSAAVTELHRKFMIRDEFSEPHNQHQNPVESQGIRWIKMHVDTVLNRSGAPDKLWLQAAKWLCDIHNNTADETLNWAIPHTVRHGDTPDISAYLMFQFYEKVFCLDVESSFPSSKELPGYFVGVSQNVGDKLTFKILTDDTERIINRSVVRSATDALTDNRRVSFDPALNLEPKDDVMDPSAPSDTDSKLELSDQPLEQVAKTSKPRKTQNLKATSSFCSTSFN